MIPLDEALKIIENNVSPVAGHANVRLENALHAITLEDIFAPYDLPPFDNSAVDGFAFRHADSKDSELATFELVGEALAGEPYTSGLLPNNAAIRIATGGMLPAGCDTIAMQEICEIEDQRVVIKNLPPIASSVRRRGNDIKKDAIAVRAGTRLGAQQIAFLHALGLETIKVRRPLRIAVISTGLELRTTGSALSQGQIIDSNGLMLKQLMNGIDAEINLLPSLPDDYDATVKKLEEASQKFDVIITTGGVSVGGRDFIRESVHDKGKVHFWKVAIKPGRPVLFGQWNKCFIAGLPGNPVSAMVTFLLIARPLLDQLAGVRSAQPTSFKIPLISPVDKEKHLRVFARAKLQATEEGVLKAQPYRDQASNLLSSLTAGDGLLDLPLGLARLESDSSVSFIPFHGLLA